jgi:hypothetical protein
MMPKLVMQCHSTEYHSPYGPIWPANQIAGAKNRHVAKNSRVQIAEQELNRSSVATAYGPRVYNSAEYVHTPFVDSARQSHADRVPKLFVAHLAAGITKHCKMLHCPWLLV